MRGRKAPESTSTSTFLRVRCVCRTLLLQAKCFCKIRRHHIYVRNSSNGQHQTLLQNVSTGKNSLFLGADTLKSYVLLRRAAPSCCCIAPLGLYCICVTPTTLEAVGAMEQQPPYKPNGTTPQHDEVARRWLLRRWECVLLTLFMTVKHQKMSQVLPLNHLNLDVACASCIFTFVIVIIEPIEPTIWEFSQFWLPRFGGSEFLRNSDVRAGWEQTKAVSHSLIVQHFSVIPVEIYSVSVRYVQSCSLMRLLACVHSSLCV